MRRIRRLSILAALVLAGSMWFYVEHLLVPYQVSSAAAHGEPRGNLSDLYPRWVGTRELLLHGRDPYSADVTREIQAGYWGRPLDSSRANDPKDESRFAYPVYVVFLLAPTVSLPFPALRIAASWILGTLTALSVPLWLRVLRWRPSYDTSAILLLLTLSSYSAVQGIKLQQLSLLVCALMAASLVLLVDGHLVAAGALLAVATIKPQLVVFLAAWLTLWAMNDWRERQRFFWSFLGTWLLLAGAGEYLLPGWVGRFIDAIVAYQHYAGTPTPLVALTTPAIGAVLEAGVLLGATAVCWRFRRAPANSMEFRLAVAVVLTATLAIMPRLAPYNQLQCLPAVFLIVQSWSSLWRQSKVSRTVCVAAALFVLWPWMASLALAVASIFLPPSAVQRAWAVPLWTSPAISIALLGPLIFLVRDSSAPRQPLS